MGILIVNYDYTQFEFFAQITLVLLGNSDQQLINWYNILLDFCNGPLSLTVKNFRHISTILTLEIKYT